MTMKSTIVILLLFASSLALADGLPVVEPEDVGFSSERLGEIGGRSGLRCREQQHSEADRKDTIEH